MDVAVGEGGGEEGSMVGSIVSWLGLGGAGVCAASIGSWLMSDGLALG